MYLRNILTLSQGTRTKSLDIRYFNIEIYSKIHKEPIMTIYCHKEKDSLNMVLHSCSIYSIFVLVTSAHHGYYRNIYHLLSLFINSFPQWRRRGFQQSAVYVCVFLQYVYKHMYTICWHISLYIVRISCTYIPTIFICTLFITMSRGPQKMSLFLW